MALTQEQKKLQQIDNARKAGLISPTKAKELRQAVKNASNGKGNVSNDVGRMVNQATNKPTPTNPGGSGGGSRPDNPDRFPDGGPIKGPPDDEYEGSEDPPEDTTVYTNKPMPTGSPGEGMQWSPVYTTDPEGRQWITDWVAIPIPGYEKPNEPPPPADGMDDLSKEGAQFRLEQLLREYGVIDDTEGGKDFLEFLKGLVTKYGGKNDATIMSYLRSHDFYKARFKGNEDRIKNGYKALSEAEYIGVESEIKKKLRDFDLDEAFYTNERVATLIGGDVSASEVGDRLTQAKKIVDNADLNVRDSLKNLYGASMGDLIGYVLDPALAHEGLKRKINAGIAYGVAASNDLTLDRSLAEQVGELTYGDERTARQGLGQAGEMARSVRRLQSIESDISLTDADVVEQQFGLDDEAGRKVKKLQSRERARFTGSSGAFTGTLSGGSGY